MQSSGCPVTCSGKYLNCALAQIWAVTTERWDGEEDGLVEDGQARGQAGALSALFRRLLDRAGGSEEARVGGCLISINLVCILSTEPTLGSVNTTTRARGGEARWATGGEGCTI